MFERLEIDGFIVWDALLPTPIEDADPFECQGAHSRLMCLAFIALLLIIDPCPEGMPYGFRSPLYKRLSQKLWALGTPVDPGLLAAAFRDRRNARIFLEFVGDGKHIRICFVEDKDRLLVITVINRGTRL